MHAGLPHQRGCAMLLLIVCHQWVPVRVLRALRMMHLLMPSKRLWHRLHRDAGVAAAERVHVIHIHGGGCHKSRAWSVGRKSKRLQRGVSGLLGGQVTKGCCVVDVRPRE